MDTLYRYVGYTLVDITKTNILVPHPQFERNQQRNWETVTQVLSLRAQLLELEYLGVVDEDLELYSFGVDYTGIHKVWAFEFAVDRDNVYSFDCDRYGTLKDDFKIAPIITGLTETISLTRPLFEVAGPSKNIYFKSLD